jgi:hypothetical protein
MERLTELDQAKLREALVTLHHSRQLGPLGEAFLGGVFHCQRVDKN